MSDVFRVLDSVTGQRVALKRARPSEHSGLHLRREFRTLAGLRHPRVIRVFDFGIDEGRPFYTMELLDGADLRNVSAETVSEACRYLRDVASALALLHSRGLIHRDIAARNVRCTRDGRAKLIDFGLLATTGAWGEIVGTVPYVAPEVTLGLPADHRADLFALGALAYLVLTGFHAYPAKTFAELIQAHRIKPTSTPTAA